MTLTDAANLACADPVVRALGAAMDLLGRLPGPLGHACWNTLVLAQDRRFSSVMQAHFWGDGVSGS